MNKILSFVIPAFNSMQFLDKCVLSMLYRELLDDLEIIIVNDGSTDNTLEIAKKYCNEYPETVRVINQENAGHGGALNTGCAAAKGKYLKAIDADDWVETQNLPEFLRMLKNCDSDVVLTQHYTVHISTNEVKKWKIYPLEFGRAYSLDEIMSDWRAYERGLNYHGITYRTEFYQKNAILFSEKVFYEDHEFATIPFCYASSITPFDLFIYDYRIGDCNQSISEQNQWKQIYHMEAVLEWLVKEYQTIALEEGSAGKAYYCRKVQGLLLSYMVTVLLVEKSKKRGRELGARMMDVFEKDIPAVYFMTKRKYRMLKAMNLLHLNKDVWDRILHSRVYRTLRKKQRFD